MEYGQFFLFLLVIVPVGIFVILWVWYLFMLPWYVKKILEETREGYKQVIREIHAGNQELKNVSEQQTRLLAMIDVEITNEKSQ
ncbi:MAG: hypothetical protein PHF14_05840 [Verrucomicrobiota bacterium]|nr:hypothetical protein [Verrucomicrobiota bacterium]